jgi:hypothetical protein
MNCQEFEKLLSPLVHDEKLESAAREAVLSHAETCSRCAARLADERSVKVGLRTLAKSLRSQTVPAHLELGLRKAFRERRAGLEPEGQQAQSPPGTVRSAAHPESPGAVRRRIFALLGLAASILLLVGLFRKTMEEPNEQASRFSRPKLDSPDPAAPRETAAKEAGLQVSQTQVTPRGTGEIKRTMERPRQVQRVRPQGTQLPARSSGSSFDEAENSEIREVRTEFIPLTVYGPLSPAEQGQMVRVRLPRSALHAFGMPVNMERSREPVQADVVLAEDGTALAVRFVR